MQVDPNPSGVINVSNYSFILRKRRIYPDTTRINIIMKNCYTLILSYSFRNACLMLVKFTYFAWKCHSPSGILSAIELLNFSIKLVKYLIKGLEIESTRSESERVWHQYNNSLFDDFRLNGSIFLCLLVMLTSYIFYCHKKAYFISTSSALHLVRP